MLGLHLRTARHYLPSQLIHRIRYNIESQLTLRIPQVNEWRYAVPAGEEPSHLGRLFRRQKIEFRHDERVLRENAERLERGEFSLLNRDGALGFPVQWEAKGTTRLWRYNLHYFDYALDLGVLAKWCGDEQAAKTLKRLIADWIDSNPVGIGVGWHSYPVSRRIVNWLQAADMASDAIEWEDNSFRKTWTQSLFQQTRYLGDHLEIDLSGNHLLANAKALFFAGAFWGNRIGARWLDHGINLLWTGLKEQFHEDGGQYERSPMYQTIVLQDYLQVVHVLQIRGQQIPSWVLDRLIKMGDCLFSMLHPDGRISLFADSAFGIAYEPFDVLAAAEHLLEVSGRWDGANPGPFSSLVQVPSRSTASVANPPVVHSSLPSTGYFILSNGEEDTQLIIDGKPMGPHHLPAHGHCSLFSYELSISGERFVVDSGVQEYESGPWRDYWRSTRAHNTVSVDGAEQSEIWASFRVGHRTRLLGYIHSQRESDAIFVGLHSGFAGQKRPTPHRRFIAALPRLRWVVMDEIFGANSHTIQSFMHFAPGVECQVEDQITFLRTESREMRLYPLHDSAKSKVKVKCVQGQTNPIQGWYAPEFGTALPNSVVELSVASSLPARIGYLLAPAGEQCTSWSFQTEQGPGFARVEFCIHSQAGTETILFNLTALPSFRT